MNNPVDSIMPYIEEIAHRLSDPYKYGAVSIMVGAGFSKNADCIDDTKSSPPDWGQLAEEMYKKIAPQNFADKEKKAAACSGINVLSLAQKYEVMFDRSSLNLLIEQSISDNSFVPGDLHKRLMSFNWNDVFTTNYDTLLERTTSQIISKNNYKFVYSPKDLPGSVRPRIIKLHGSIGQSSDYIITEEDYRIYPMIYAPFVNTVQQSMLETRLCLMGFSGDDPNFLSWIGWLRDNLDKSSLSIYLFGIFDDLSVADKKLIEKRGITIIDLSLLVSKDTKNKYLDSYSKFFDLLDSRITQENVSILSTMPKAHKRIIDKLAGKDLEDYNKSVDCYADTVWNYISKYACLPNEESKKLSSFFYNELEYLLSNISIHDIGKYVNKCCYILYYCHCVLYDPEASKLEKIISESNEDNDYIKIYLLQMYRIDGKCEEYRKLKTIIDNKLESKDITIKNEYNIEFSKYYLSQFQYQEAINCVNSISTSSNEIQQIKKAILLIETNKRQEAIEILKQLKSAIIQKKYSENKIASLLGYINLVYRAAAYLILDNNFSDKDYEMNKFNCRRILIDMEEELIKSTFRDEANESKQNITFRPNTYRSTVSYGKQIGDDTVADSFNYILLYDLLCLCQYSDQSDAYISATKHISLYSFNPIWKWYRIFMMGDVKKYEYFFTRVQIYTAEASYSEWFFDAIIRLIIEQQEVDQYLLREIDYNCMFNIASRFSIVVDSKRIINLLKVLFSFVEKYPDHSDTNRILDDVMTNIKNCIDEDVMNYIISYNPANIMNYEILQRIDLRLRLNPSFKSAYENLILKYLKSKDSKERNYAVELYQIFKDDISSKNRSQIKKYLWAQTDENGFPKNNSFLPTIWIDESRKKTKAKFKNFILNPNIPHEVTSECAFAFSVKPFQEISTYYSVLFRIVSMDNYISINAVEVYELIEYFKNYLNKEKALLQKDSFFIFNNSKKKFDFLISIILLLLLYTQKHKIENEEIKSSINEIISICEKVDLDCYEIKSLENNTSLYDDFKHYESYPFHNNNNDMFLPYLCIYGKLYLMNTSDRKEAVTHFLEFIKTLSFMDVIHNNKCFLNAPLIIDFIPQKESIIKSLINTLEVCYDRYALIINEKQSYERSKACLDGMYNISNFTMELYRKTKNNDTLAILFYPIAERFKNNKLNEIRLPWINMIS